MQKTVTVVSGFWGLWALFLEIRKHSVELTYLLITPIPYLYQTSRITDNLHKPLRHARTSKVWLRFILYSKFLLKNDTTNFLKYCT